MATSRVTPTATAARETSRGPERNDQWGRMSTRISSAGSSGRACRQPSARSGAAGSSGVRPSDQSTEATAVPGCNTPPIASAPVEPTSRRPHRVPVTGSSGRAPTSPRPSSGRWRRRPTPMCIVAGAGSGKTRVLTLRVARRILDGSAEADHTVVCTFTRKAAFELRDRLGRYGVPGVDPRRPPGGVPTPGVRAGTLHQLALTLLRRRAADAGRPPPSIVEHRWRTLVELCRRPGDRGGRRHGDRVGQGPGPRPRTVRRRCHRSPSGAPGRRPGHRALRRLRGPARPAGPARPRRRAVARRPISSATTRQPPSSPTGATGTWPSTSSRTSTRPSSG